MERLRDAEPAMGMEGCRAAMGMKGSRISYGDEGMQNQPWGLRDAEPAMGMKGCRISYGDEGAPEPALSRGEVGWWMWLRADTALPAPGDEVD